LALPGHFRADRALERVPQLQCHGLDS
jgi:hypothetical protein